MDIFTPEDMIRYLYNETSAEETAAISLALETDWSLKEKFEILKRSIESLDRIQRSPRAKAIESILRYAGVNKAVEQD
ncbi:MAG: hypothetical protein C5B52_10750 [Bacteroidetes bacterium]|nr:MAG: hypothetical protein C5B52_10750 [Bacteroidota bacterium]